uniref:Uncharacterized protein n=1 Tax=Caulobacter sp. (strain K31) TaxID=366602 RepID=B0SUS4_CAUSK
MDFGAALDVAIGLIFIYLLVSLFVTALQEFIASRLNKRSNYLVRRIECLLSDGRGEGWSAELTQVWNNPLIKSLKTDNVSEDGATPKNQLYKNAPSYIAGPTFAMALVDTLRPGGVTTSTMKDLKSAVASMENKELQKILLPMLANADDKVENFQDHVGHWFDAAMDRTSGVYKRWAQRVTFWLGIGAALLLNINTFGVIDTLWRDPVARAAVVAQAQQAELPRRPVAATAPADASAAEASTVQPLATEPPATEEPAPTEAPDAAAAEIEPPADESATLERRDNATDAIQALALPVGWTWENICQLGHYPHDGPPDRPQPTTKGLGYDFTCTGTPRGAAFTILQIVLTVAGIFITGLAISLGAPFWFGILQTVTNIRSSGTKPDRTDGTKQK